MSTQGFAVVVFGVLTVVILAVVVRAVVVGRGTRGAAVEIFWILFWIEIALVRPDDLPSVSKANSVIGNSRCYIPLLAIDEGICGGFKESTTSSVTGGTFPVLVMIPPPRLLCSKSKGLAVARKILSSSGLKVVSGKKKSANLVFNSRRHNSGTKK